MIWNLSITAQIIIGIVSDLYIYFFFVSSEQHVGQHIIMPLQESEGYRLHLKALVRQERDHAYRRHDYLSHEWQKKKSTDQSRWQSSSSSAAAVAMGIKDDHYPSPDEKKKFLAQQPQRHSPSSVGNIMSPEDDDDDEDFDAPASSDRMCIRWREKIIEWKYQVVDRFGT